MYKPRVRKPSDGDLPKRNKIKGISPMRITKATEKISPIIDESLMSSFSLDLS